MEKDLKDLFMRITPLRQKYPSLFLKLCCRTLQRNTETLQAYTLLAEMQKGS